MNHSDAVDIRYTAGVDPVDNFSGCCLEQHVLGDADD